MEKTQKRFYLTVLSLTVSIMYIIAPQIKLLLESQFYFAIFGLGSGIAFYKLLTIGLIRLAESNNCVKKLFLGPYYLNGTWVGWFGNNNEKFYVVDRFEQSLTSLQINGVARLENNLDERATWKSEAVAIDVEKGSLKFLCEVDFANNTSAPAVTNFRFTRNHKYDPPFRIDGSSTNINDPKTRMEIHQIKLSSNTIMSDNEAFEKAVEFKKNGDIPNADKLDDCTFWKILFKNFGG